MKNVIIYGGAFNPPTVAHHSITKACCDYAESIKAEFWLMPSGDRTDKAIGIDVTTRLKILKAFMGDFKNGPTKLRIEESEVHLKVSTETCDTVRRLEAEYPKVNFYWVFGADSVLTMRQWNDGDWLWDHINMLVIPREGFTVKQIPSKASILKVSQPIVSSTEVRSLIRRGLGADHLVPKSVAEIVRDLTY